MKYDVTITYSATVEVQIEADSEKEAETKALSDFDLAMMEPSTENTRAFAWASDDQ